MKLVEFSVGSAACRPGILVDDVVIDISAQGYSDLASVIASGNCPTHEGQRYPRSLVKIEAPLLHPPRIFCRSELSRSCD